MTKMTLTELINTEGSGAAAVRWLGRKGIVISYMTLVRWCHGWTKPSPAYLALLLREGVDATK